MSWRSVNPNSDLYTADYFLSEYVCRLCWCQNGAKDITLKMSDDAANNLTVSEIIYECIGVDLTINTRLTKICSSCWNEVQNLFEFRTFCHTTQSRLAGIFEYRTSEEPKISETNEFSDLELDEVNALFQDVINEDSETETIEPPYLNTEIPQKCSYCFECKTNFESEDSLIQHKIDQHNIKNSFKCFRCDKTFRIKTLCVRHEIECWKASKNGYKCDTCGKFLHDKNSYKQHLTAHKNITAALFKCKKCMKTFMTKELLQEHSVIHKNRKWICDICGHVFFKQFNLVNHKLMHDGIKQHVCPHCDYRTTYKNSLVIHIRKHTGERPYACSMCPQRCVTKSNLRKHMRLHLGIKRFHCNICDKKFTYKVSLEEHVSRIHEQRTKQHCCEECGATYSWSQDLRRHVLAKHGDSPVKYKRKKRTSVLGTEVRNGCNEDKVVDYEIPCSKL